MKYVLTGGAGHITKPAALQLLAAGHEVTVISRNADNVKELTDKGAAAATGSVDDEVFMTAAMQGADAVYLMIPPTFSPAGEWRDHQGRVSDVLTNALKNSKVRNAVVLSSMGAHLGKGTGPVDGLFDFEKKLSALPDVNVLFLRPSFFYYNLFNQIPLIKGMNIMGGNYMGSDEKLVLTHTNDIAAVLASAMLRLDFSGHMVRYIASDAKTTGEIATVLGNAIGKPGIPWVVFSDEQTFGGMQQAGLPDTIARGYTDLGSALRSGKLQEDYWKNPTVSGSVKLEDFAKEFAAAFNAG